MNSEVLQDVVSVKACRSRHWWRRWNHSTPWTVRHQTPRTVKKAGHLQLGISDSGCCVVCKSASHRPKALDDASSPISTENKGLVETSDGRQQVGRELLFRSCRFLGRCSRFSRCRLLGRSSRFRGCAPGSCRRCACRFCHPKEPAAPPKPQKAPQLVRSSCLSRSSCWWHHHHAHQCYSNPPLPPDHGPPHKLAAVPSAIQIMRKQHCNTSTSKACHGGHDASTRSSSRYLVTSTHLPPQPPARRTVCHNPTRLHSHWACFTCVLLCLKVRVGGGVGYYRAEGEGGGGQRWYLQPPFGHVALRDVCLCVVSVVLLAAQNL